MFSLELEDSDRLVNLVLGPVFKGTGLFHGQLDKKNGTFLGISDRVIRLVFRFS